jgi:D-alanyl-D-alanine carboxypeptidase (penicillin-binding protein 5/6)
VLGSALLSLVAMAGPLVPLGAAAATAANPAPAPSISSAPSPPHTPASPVPGIPCAIGDLVSIAVPTPSPLPTHDPDLPTIGGELLAGNGLSVPTGSPALPTKLAATSWLVADLDSGEVLGACGAHRYAAPASVQKLLLAATVLPKLAPTDVTTITAEDLHVDDPDSTLVYLKLGGAYTVEDLFLGLLLRSGNDAANVLARLVGGSRGKAGGLDDMNAEAHRLGAWDTHAATSSGLDGPGQVTSVYDLALIFRVCFGYENFRRYLRTETARMPAADPNAPVIGMQRDTGFFLFGYPGALGSKTGWTTNSGHTFVGAAERDGHRLVVAMLGAQVLPTRAWQQSASLLDWGFSLARGASVGRLVDPGDAEKLMAPPPSPTPEVATAAAVVSLPSQSQPSMVLVMVGAGAVAFGSAWVLAIRLSRRRRTGRRQWRAETGTAALVGATNGQGETQGTDGTTGTAGRAEPAADATADRTPVAIPPPAAEEAAMPPPAAEEAPAAMPPPAAEEAPTAMPPPTSAVPTATLPPADPPVMGQPPP